MPSLALRMDSALLTTSRKHSNDFKAKAIHSTNKREWELKWDPYWSKEPKWLLYQPNQKHTRRIQSIFTTTNSKLYFTATTSSRQ